MAFRIKDLCCIIFPYIRCKIVFKKSLSLGSSESNSSSKCRTKLVSIYFLAVLASTSLDTTSRSSMSYTDCQKKKKRFNTKSFICTYITIKCHNEVIFKTIKVKAKQQLRQRPQTLVLRMYIIPLKLRKTKVTPRTQEAQLLNFTTQVYFSNEKQSKLRSLHNKLL